MYAKIWRFKGWKNHYLNVEQLTCNFVNICRGGPHTKYSPQYVSLNLLNLLFQKSGTNVNFSYYFSPKFHAMIVIVHTYKWPPILYYFFVQIFAMIGYCTQCEFWMVNWWEFCIHSFFCILLPGKMLTYLIPLLFYFWNSAIAIIITFLESLCHWLQW